MGVWDDTLPAAFVPGKVRASDLEKMRAALDALTSAWASYTPTWSSSGTQPVVNNGTIESRYTRVGDFWVWTGRLAIGGTTSIGTGVYSISSPIALESGNRYFGVGLLLDSSTGTNNQPLGIRPDGGSAIRAYGTGGQWSATVPVTPASGDTIGWTVIGAAA